MAAARARCRLVIDSVVRGEAEPAAVDDLVGVRGQLGPPGPCLLVAQFDGVVPARLDGYTTLVTVAVDCAVIASTAIAAGLLIWRRRPQGYLMAVPLLSVEALLAPLIAAQTVGHLSAGDLGPRPDRRPVPGFVVLALAAVAVVWSVLRRIPDNRAAVVGRLAIRPPPG